MNKVAVLASAVFYVVLLQLCKRAKYCCYFV